MKISWMLFLIGFSCLMGACKDVDKEYAARFIYHNESNGNVEMILMGEIQENTTVIAETIKKYSISPDSSIEFEFFLPTNSELTKMPEGILKQNNFLGDSVQINFESGKTMMFYRDRANNDSIYLESNYRYTQADHFSVEFLFKFK